MSQPENPQPWADLQFIATNKTGTARELVERKITPIRIEEAADQPLAMRMPRVVEYSEDYAPPIPQEQREVLSSESVKLFTLIKGLELFSIDIQMIEGGAQLIVSSHEQRKQQLKNAFKGKPPLKKLGQAGEIFSQEKDSYSARHQHRKEQSTVLKETTALVVVKEYFGKPGGMERLVLQLTELTELGLISEVEVIDLLATAVDAVTKLPDKEVGIFGYKATTNNLHTAEQAQPLTDVLNVVFGKPEQVRWQVNKIADALFIKWVRAQHSLYGAEEPTPTIALAYDILYAARCSTQSGVFTSAYEWVMEYLKMHQENGQTFSRELTTIADQSGAEISLLQEQVTQKQQQSGINSLDDERLLAEFSPLSPKTPHIVGKQYERSTAMSVVANLLDHFLPASKIPAMKKLFKEARRFVSLNSETSRRIGEGEAASRVFNQDQRFAQQWRSLVANEYTLAPHLDALLTAILPEQAHGIAMHNLAGGSVSWELLDSVVAAEIEKRAREGQGLSRNFDHIITQHQLQLVFHDQPEPKLSSDEFLEWLNIELKDIFVTNTWLVADRGDMFTAAGDEIGPEESAQGILSLQDLGISSLSLYPADEALRSKCGGKFGYRIEIKLSGSHNARAGQIDLFFNQAGQFFSLDGRPVILGQWVEKPLQQLTIQRLRYITDGLADLNDPEENKIKLEGEAAEKDSESSFYRRAFWMKLRGSRYTLTSRDAQAHAAAVLADPRYGINIMERNMQGKASGRLKSDEWETFVMATKVSKKTSPYKHTFSPGKNKK